jgi:hypothetical protein
VGNRAKPWVSLMCGRGLAGVRSPGHYAHRRNDTDDTQFAEKGERAKRRTRT